ncbi:hypothetical protein ABLE93_09340 [Xanthobacter sp. KR7-65]|uniref:hypothetical protein n=1 Tax=Xanthobacter sp. KR7-65 TaxID=3156612 RepID=UPI0032B355CA
MSLSSVSSTPLIPAGAPRPVEGSASPDAPASAGQTGHGRDLDHAPDHGIAHDHSAHSHAASSHPAHVHRPASARPRLVARIAPSVLRLSLAGRLALAGGCLAVMWAVVVLVLGSSA